MYIRLIRNEPKGNAITGRLVVDNAQLTMDTLEHFEYAIPCGFYRLRMTYSPAFQQILPILDGVLGYARDPQSGMRRTGIRIHAGNTIEHTTGCILVGEADEQKMRLLSSRKALEQLIDYLLTYQTQHPHEEVYIHITSTDPFADADSAWNDEE